jgi:NAD(P)-dependent dehydrogenase (short-subunit alcohol dehydrogenase family)
MNKVALIAGAGSELGQEIARGLHNAGLRVALNDILPTRIEPLAAELGESAAAFPGDLARKLGLQTMLQAVLERWERIDVLVFIPTAQPDVALLDMDEWDWHRTIDADLTAAFLCMQSVGRIMRELGGGLIVNVFDAREMESSVYAAAAGGLAILSKAAAVEFSSYDIAVHALRAGKKTAADIVRLVQT